MLDFLAHCVRGAPQQPDQRRHRRRQDDAAQRAVQLHLANANASSPSKTPPSCSCSSRTWRGSRPARRTSKARAQSASAHLVINALRMRPDRIVVGEVRGEEALDMLQAMNTGHDGSLTTIHANTPRDALSRLETMVAMGATEPARARDPPADRVGDPARRAADAPQRRLAQGHQHLGNHRHGRRHHHHAGDLRVREDRASPRTARSSAGSARPASGRSAASA